MSILNVSSSQKQKRIVEKMALDTLCQDAMRSQRE